MIRSKILKEEWKTVEFDFEFTNKTRFEVSNCGNVRSFNKVSDGRILNGSLTEGFKVIRLKLYKPREEKEEQKEEQLIYDEDANSSLKNSSKKAFH